MNQGASQDCNQAKTKQGTNHERVEMLKPRGLCVGALLFDDGVHIEQLLEQRVHAQSGGRRRIGRKKDTSG